MINRRTDAVPVQVIDFVDGKVEVRDQIENESPSVSKLGIALGANLANFGSAEIALPLGAQDCVDGFRQARPSTELRRALMECHRETTTQLLVRGWKEKVYSFASPYKLYIEMLVGGAAAVDHVLSEDYFRQHRKRTPSPEKVALIAMTVFVKPEKEDRSACSDYACVLEHARDMNVSPGDLAEWLLATTLSICKRKIRAKRRTEQVGVTAGPEILQAPPVTTDSLPDTSNLEVTSWHTDNGMEQVVKFECRLGRVNVNALATSGAPLVELLRRLVEQLEKAAVTEKGHEENV
ncbi:hypothetical protein LB554_15255 [Mesorhizobium sp. CO1-1-11]|uniref:hypothetical protein n=1 Tax=Mesorhizobium sp. CO1-1-11 TaxID=2876636 RepID=UPI001CCD459F|nr:hypothetical protein [Mesorhizobium sp. CO1-1-11]MBZ9725308.1 hypothetical protein [Mesorhizobium sp. CO1-1-11]